MTPQGTIVIRAQVRTKSIQITAHNRKIKDTQKTSQGKPQMSQMSLDEAQQAHFLWSCT